VPDLDVDADAVHAIFYRHIPHAGDPMYIADPATDGRWQHGDTVAAWYFADEPDTAWAEWYRALAEVAIPPAESLPRDLWRWRIDLEHVALLDTRERLEPVGLRLPTPTTRHWSAYQDVGDALYRDGYAGLLAVAAARPAHRNLVVFRERRSVDGCAPLQPPTVVAQPPRVPRGMRT